MLNYYSKAVLSSRTKPAHYLVVSGTAYSFGFNSHGVVCEYVIIVFCVCRQIVQSCLVV